MQSSVRRRSCYEGVEWCGCGRSGRQCLGLSAEDVVPLRLVATNNAPARAANCFEPAAKAKPTALRAALTAGGPTRPPFLTARSIFAPGARRHTLRV